MHKKFQVYWTLIEGMTVIFTIITMTAKYYRITRCGGGRSKYYMIMEERGV